MSITGSGGAVLGGLTVVSSRRTLSAFLSYWGEDAAFVTELQRALQLRGVKPWRDRNDLRYGSDFEGQIRRAIRDEVSAFVAFLTPGSLLRPVIWDIEVSEALARNEREPNFQLIPIFCGVSPEQVVAHCAARGLRDLSTLQGQILQPSADSTEIKGAARLVARKSLHAGLELRLSSAHAYEPSLLMRTDAHAPGEPGVDLELDWTEPFADGCPTEDVWGTDLLPAIRDLREVVGSCAPRKRLNIQVVSRLSASVALGETFSAAAKYHLTLLGANGEWASDTPRRTSRVLHATELSAPGGDATAAVIDVSISRFLGGMVATHVASLNPKPARSWRLEPVAGASSSAVEDASWAITAAWEVGDFLRGLHDRAGVRQFHMYIAAPSEWCVLLGHTLNAVGQLIIYQYNRHTGHYERACVLGPQSC